MSHASWPAHSVPLSSKRTVTVNLVRLPARVVDIIAPRNTTHSLEEESSVPKKQPDCAGCGKKLKEVPTGNGWAHKKKEHWVSSPHKAVPVAVG